MYALSGHAEKVSLFNFDLFPLLLLAILFSMYVMYMVSLEKRKTAQ